MLSVERRNQIMRTALSRKLAGNGFTLDPEKIRSNLPNDAKALGLKPEEYAALCADLLPDIFKDCLAAFEDVAKAA